MAKVKSRKHHRSTQFIVLAASLPFIAHAADHQDKESAVKLPTISVKSEDKKGYKVDAVSSPKYTQPLVDTPQTISVINKQLLQEQGATSLVDALRNTPGITLQLGENGNTSAGDAFQMRGFSTQTSTYLDGVRDLGAVSRDVFNLEQIEVVKGPSGSEVGRGAASGYINLVSKLPSLINQNSLTANYNTAEHVRLAADINQAINNNTAIRLNAMGENGGIEGRDVLKKNGWAIAPSIAFGLDTPTRVYLYSQHVRQENIPDGGIPTVGLEGFYYGYSSNYANAKNSALQNKIRDDINSSAQAKEVNQILQNAPTVNRENFYGNVNDFEDVKADLYTAKIESDLSESVKFTNITRLGKTHMQRVLTGINSISAPSVNITVNPDDTYSYAFNYANFDRNNPSSWTIGRSRQGVDQENKILANQSTINWNFNTGRIEHDLVAGLELLKEQQYTKTMNTQTPGQKAPSTVSASLYHPDKNQVLPQLVDTGAYSDGQTDTAALYFFDTIKLHERFHVNAGIRADYYDTKYDALARTTDSTTLTITDKKTKLGANDTLFSWKLGALFKPTSFSSVYATYAKSLTPPGSANFSLSDTGANSNNAKPQETHHYEVGTKWDLLEGKLSLNAAAYRTENENQFTIDPISKLSVQEAKKRIEGVELSAVGQITDAWNISGGIAHMKIKQLNQRSETAVTVAERWSPEWTASLWTTYDIAGFKVGLGARYVDDQKRVITNSTLPANMPAIPGYVVFDALAGYTFNKNASVNLNIYNLADKDYISTLNNSGARVVLGQPRSAALSLNYTF